MAFEKYSTEKLKKLQRVLLVSGIVALVLMCFVLGYGLYLSSQKDNNTLIYLVPTVMGPLAIFLSLISASIGGELKKRAHK